MRGLDSEEADFLEFVSERQQELERERLKEEAETLALLRVNTLILVFPYGHCYAMHYQIMVLYKCTDVCY